MQVVATGNNFGGDPAPSAPLAYNPAATPAAAEQASSIPAAAGPGVSDFHSPVAAAHHQSNQEPHNIVVTSLQPAVPTAVAVAVPYPTPVGGYQAHGQALAQPLQAGAMHPPLLLARDVRVDPTIRAVALVQLGVGVVGLALGWSQVCASCARPHALGCLLPPGYLRVLRHCVNRILRGHACGGRLTRTLAGTDLFPGGKCGMRGQHLGIMHHAQVLGVLQVLLACVRVLLCARVRGRVRVHVREPGRAVTAADGVRVAGTPQQDGIRLPVVLQDL